MPFNRGVKRNAFVNRNFNRGSGGGAGGGGNNTGSGVGPGGVGMTGGVGGGPSAGASAGGGRSGMNPWESGLMPGRGILPTPSNNLSLNSPQAQLVIASNLLSNLLRTQQDTQPQVPSLLSLGNNMNGPNSNFRGQQNFSTGRFNDRRPNMKNPRPQPYNKMGNRARDAVTGRRGPSAQQSRAQSQSGNQRINGNQNQHRNDKTSKPNPASKQNQTIKKEPQDVKTSDNEKAETQPIAKSEENETNGDNKNDNKEEKNEDDAAAINVNNVEVPSTAEPAKESPAESDNTVATTNATSFTAKKPDDNQPSGKKSEARHAESRYAAVPISHMFCHVCTKHMWDGFSFENHLRGRAHQLMMEKLDQSYKLRVDFMRHDLKVAEEQRELTLINSKRRGKKVPVDLSVREYCTMCDLNFYGTLSSHRKSEKHQQLKIFLHPRCIPCAKEFPSRIEYDDHCLTPSHMVNVAQNEEQKKTKKNKLAKGESEVRTGEDEEKDIGSDLKSNENDEEMPENTECLFDINEDMNNEKYKIPSFKYCRQNQIAVGASLVKEVQGYHCEKCRRFMLTEEDMHLHLRTLSHYRSFVAEVKAQTTSTAPETNVEKAIEQEPLKQEEISQPDEEDGIEAKRRKIEDSIENDIPSLIKTETLNATLSDDIDLAKKPDGDEIYDPLEADADSEEGEKTNMNKNDDASAKDDDNKNEQSMEVWGDGDNDNEPEVGNLLDDGENDHIEAQTSVEPQTPSTQPEASPTQSQTATFQLQTSTPNPPTSTATQPQAQIQSQQQQQQQQQLQSTLTVDVNQLAKKNNSPLPGNNLNTPQGKSPRGRGFRGRGHQRARRSRR